MAEAVVDLEAVTHNARTLARAAAGSELMAAVKADGFGHGAVPVARAALAGGATWLGVTSAEEALSLRGAGIGAPMLSWLHPFDQDYGPLVAAGVDVSVATAEALDAVAGLGAAAWVHLKVDTGLSRGGAPLAEWGDLVTRARKLELAGDVRVRGVWSHLANAEAADAPEWRRQLRVLREAIAEARSAGLRPGLNHLANSAAVLQLPATHLDMVRVGIGLYGVEPVPGRTFGLLPAMTLRSRVVLVKRVPAGAGVSYGPDHVTDRETTLALLPVGFADGIPRAASGRGEVLVRGRRRPVVGRVAMDQCVVDVGDEPVRPGDPVVVFGPGDDGEPTAADWARWAGTNAHEILTGVGPRVHRVYR
jgi:alanine racemase